VYFVRDLEPSTSNRL